ncbi:hypothetical protein BACCIP111895_04147 [Neobacillus rhizosphaerae]|jgi:hypothetical protein|uniref:Uncharacterized protein n=1 Tax=Neobacillus rhizosphaerae TaxID=2880965 RepID=A0ABM9EW82_9BACI|nr:hypothetical protein BACCIP111895_04147 [Neobacillus rhizosphaerae]
MKVVEDYASQLLIFEDSEGLISLIGLGDDHIDD